MPSQGVDVIRIDPPPPVTPRVRIAASGAALPLEYHVRGLLRAGACGLVNLSGPPGSGKTFALEHIARRFIDEPRLRIIDENSLPEQRPPSDALAIFTSRNMWGSADLLMSLQMAPWTDDDLIEYLASTHRQRVASVMRRVMASPARDQLEGLAELWQIVLDVLAADESIADIWAALRWYVGLEIPDLEQLHRTRLHCLSNLVIPNNVGLPVVYLDQFDPRLRRLIRHRAIQLPLAAEALVLFARMPQKRAEFGRKLSHEVLRQVAMLGKSSSDCVQAFLEMASRGPGQSNAATVLHAMEFGWRPDSGSVCVLRDAHLCGAQWADVNLHECQADGVNFAGADLTGASLCGANLQSADFSRARLRRARLLDINAFRANFSAAVLSDAVLTRAELAQSSFECADLSHANLCESNLSSTNLTGARFCGAYLVGANLGLAQIADADFSNAKLTGARLFRMDLTVANFRGAVFTNAEMNHCNLEYVEWPGACFSGAFLHSSLLTGSILPRADFRRAELCNAGLADVQWEGADIRGADLTGASFHAGSTRSGLAGSTIASEGTRTGFYTDDFNSQNYKPPEEIRTANLCGADLRNAKTDSVDFYLVDLRGARYARSQAKWFRKCGAIL